MEKFLLEKKSIFLLLIVLFFLVLLGQFSLEVMDRDEARVAQSSKQMLQSNDFIVPKFQDEIRAKKPIIIYWLQAISAKVFGEKTISSYRLPSLLGFMLSIYFTYTFCFL